MWDWRSSWCLSHIPNAWAAPRPTRWRWRSMRTSPRTVRPARLRAPMHQCLRSVPRASVASCGTPRLCRCTVRHQQGQGGAHLVPAPHRVRRGSTSRVSSMHDHSPPTTGAAVRADTSAPTPDSHSSGKRPRTVVATVITSGRTRALAPSTTAASTSSGFWMRPSRMYCRKASSSTPP